MDNFFLLLQDNTALHESFILNVHQSDIKLVVVTPYQYDAHF